MHGSQHLGVRLIQNKQVDGRMDRWMGGWQVTSVATTRQVGLYWLCTGLGVRQGAIRHQSKSSRGATDAFLAGAAEQTACPHGAAGAHVRWPGFDAVGGGSAQQMPAHSQDLSVRLGPRLTFCGVGNCRGCSVKKQKDSMNISLGGAVPASRNVWQALQGAGSPVQEAGL